MRFAALVVMFVTASCRLDSAGVGDPRELTPVDTGTIADTEPPEHDTLTVEDSDIDPVDVADTEPVLDTTIDAPPDVSPKCVGLPDPIYLAAKNKCYWVVPPTTGANVADAECRKTGTSDHITYVGGDEQPTITALAARAGRLLWIGLKSAGGTDAEDFAWMNGESNSYRNWAASQPKNGDGGCVIVRTDGKWENRSCDQLHPTICERD